MLDKIIEKIKEFTAYVIYIALIIFVLALLIAGFDSLF